jgi:long-chain acyl-CoA synthetase
MLRQRLFDFVLHQRDKEPLKRMMHSRLAGEWRSISTRDFVKQMNYASKGLCGLGIQPGDKVALIVSGNRLEWNILDHAIMQIGAVGVPIYPTMTPSDTAYILNHSESKLCFVSDEKLFRKVSQLLPQTPGVQQVFTFEKIDSAPHWESIFNHSENIEEEQLKALRNKVREDQLATIIYTSGTTGLPKGVMLSHKNIASNVISSKERLPHLKRGSRCVSFLPCCHIYERMLHYLYIHSGVEIYLTGMETIKDDLSFARPHIFTAVPRLFEKFYDGIVSKGSAAPGMKGKIFRWAHDLALRWEPEGGNGVMYELKLSIARALVFGKVRKALGLENIKAIASGSAPLQARHARFFNAAEMPVLEGYGLTETSPVITVNTFRRTGMYRNGSVGKCISGVEVKIADDGEILCKGPNVMMGYYKDDAQTADIIRNRWFHTGDIGKVEDGFLFITDRKKELFKTSAGKYIAPQLLENALKESAFIDQVVVTGEGQKFAAALIVPDYGKLKDAIACDQNISAESLIARDEVKKLMYAEVEKINVRFGSWEKIRAFRLLPRALSIEEGEITPTLKLKRKVIYANWKALIDDCFDRD